MPTVRRLGDSAPAGLLGASPAEDWVGVATGRGAGVSWCPCRASRSLSPTAEPGTWFGDIALFDGLPRTHDADCPWRHHACWCVRKADFKELLSQPLRAVRRACCA
ncbi:cyclic nucleotide-binding domain-containing protein [Paucibacter sp. O1-1]|nr:cyclic nucleotide-binding domain-containing protein [Paucibacter sp. O1-1]MDA3824794.1 cyclic nucleotide-binding domain-containing protein [Paucibacter sp. O1-1]